jgi:hypothetical protein
LGIALLLFLEDLAAEALAAFRGSLSEVRARPLVALRFTADAFLDPLEILFLRVFCDTACVRGTATPLFEVFTGTRGPKSGQKPVLRLELSLY